MAFLPLTQLTAPSPATNIKLTDHAPRNDVPTPHALLSPPASPTFPLHDAKVSHYTKPAIPPRFPRNPCPTAHYTLSLLSSEHEAQRLFGNTFSLRSPTTGELLGPFALLSYTDAWIPSYCRYIHRVVSSPVFTARERELIVLAVASETRAAYVAYAHRRIAESVGLSERVVEGVLARGEWTDLLDLSGRERNVYRVAAEMAGGWGRVSEGTWSDVVVKDRPRVRGQEGWLEREAEGVDGEGVVGGVHGSFEEKDDGGGERLTREEVATLAQVLASTMFVSVLVNCADVEVPEDDGEVVQQP